MSDQENMDFLVSKSTFQADNTDKIQPTTFIKKPMGAIFTSFYIFKVLPFLTYLFGGIFFNNNVFLWVLTIITNSIDFWFTKNVAGRLILGMRWSNIVNTEGESEWKFEHVSREIPDRFGQRKTFWIILFSTVGIWGLFTFFNLIKLNIGWLFITSIATILSATNTWGFIKCDQNLKEKFQNGAQNLILNNLIPFLTKSKNNENNKL